MSVSMTPHVSRPPGGAPGRAGAVATRGGGAPAERAQELARSRPFPPGVRGNGHPVDVELFEELQARDPATANSRIHNLQITTVSAPGDHAVSAPVRLADHDDGGKSLCLGEQKVIE